jgi:hypothetical protein
MGELSDCRPSLGVVPPLPTRLYGAVFSKAQGYRNWLLFQRSLDAQGTSARLLTVTSSLTCRNS